jgi:uncharacterized protein (DUF1684 family)
VIRLAIPLLAAAAVLAAATIESEIAEWRRARATGLRADGGWLTVTGLFWLHEGTNRFGRDPSNDITLPDGPPHAGTLRLRGGKVTMEAPGQAARELRPDSEDAARAGRLNLFVIARSGKFGIRLKDPESEYRRNFHGLEYFPASERYRVTARFVAEPRKLAILNILGQTEEQESPGYAVFRLGEREFRLRPVLEGPTLFFIFRDQTAGKETYGAGRFLNTPMPENGRVVLDFNKAYNPPCAFTPYATCPLPPPENKLAVRIEAGEKKYGH